MDFYATQFSHCAPVLELLEGEHRVSLVHSLDFKVSMNHAVTVEHHLAVVRVLYVILGLNRVFKQVRRHVIVVTGG